jgi:hypothetical protein
MDCWTEAKNHFDEIVKLTRSVGKLFQMSENNGLGWYLKEIEYLPKIIENLLPSKVGDKVVLVKDVECKGMWKHSQHFLKTGSTAVISSLGIQDGKMYANLVFDNESFIDYAGKEQLITTGKYCYGLGFEYFKNVVK